MPFQDILYDKHDGDAYSENIGALGFEPLALYDNSDEAKEGKRVAVPYDTLPQSPDCPLFPLFWKSRNRNISISCS